MRFINEHCDKNKSPATTERVLNVYVERDLQSDMGVAWFFLAVQTVRAVGSSATDWFHVFC